MAAEREKESRGEGRGEERGRDKGVERIGMEGRWKGRTDVRGSGDHTVSSATWSGTP